MSEDFECDCRPPGPGTLVPPSLAHNTNKQLPSVHAASATHRPRATQEKTPDEGLGMAIADSLSGQAPVFSWLLCSQPILWSCQTVAAVLMNGYCPDEKDTEQFRLCVRICGSFPCFCYCSHGFQGQIRLRSTLAIRSHFLSTFDRELSASTVSACGPASHCCMTGGSGVPIKVLPAS